MHRLRGTTVRYVHRGLGASGARELDVESRSGSGGYKTRGGQLISAERADSIGLSPCREDGLQG